MEEITAGLKNLRLNYVPPNSFPYERKDDSDEKFDDVIEVCAEDMIQQIDEWLEANKNAKSIKLPRRSGHVFADSVNRFVYSGATRNVKVKVANIAISLLNVIRKLLVVNDSSVCTPRKLYYLLRNDASCEVRNNVTPDNVNECLLDLCCLFQCTRKSLKLNYAPTSCVFGSCIQYEEIDIHGNTLVTDCSGMLRSYRLHLDHIHNVIAAKSSPANFILIVEKLAVLENLIEEKFCLKHPCVLVTGCGQPDVQCRMFVKMLHDSLRIPICAMVDFNAYGIEIMKSFKVDSSYLAYESYKLIVPSLKFVGLSGHDIQECNIHISKLTDMSPVEVQKAKRLKDENWVKDTMVFPIHFRVILNGRRELTLRFWVSKKDLLFLLKNISLRR